MTQVPPGIAATRLGRSPRESPGHPERGLGRQPCQPRCRAARPFRPGQPVFGSRRRQAKARAPTQRWP